jgi:hypothetical protein
LTRYIKFVSSFIGQPKEKFKTELHHICPKALFQEFSDLRKHKWNASNLTHRQHFIAHWLLWKAYPTNEMTHAFWSMCHWNRSSKPNSKVYQSLKEDRANKLSIWFSENNPMHREDVLEKFPKFKSEQHKTNIGKSNIGKHSKPIHSKEQKQLYAEMMTGSNNPMFGKSAVKGRKWYNNNTKSAYLLPSDTIPIGFTKGRLKPSQNVVLIHVT